MKFPGYFVSAEGQRVIIERTEFDETELDPNSDWKECWQNADDSSKKRGYVQLDKALQYASEVLAKM